MWIWNSLRDFYFGLKKFICATFKKKLEVHAFFISECPDVDVFIINEFNDRKSVEFTKQKSYNDQYSYAVNAIANSGDILLIKPDSQSITNVYAVSITDGNHFADLTKKGKSIEYNSSSRPYDGLFYGGASYSLNY